MIKYNTVLKHWNHYWYQLKNLYKLEMRSSTPMQARLNACLYDSLEKIRKEDFNFILQLIDQKRTCTTDVYCLDCLNNLESEIKKLIEQVDIESNNRPQI